MFYSVAQKQNNQNYQTDLNNWRSGHKNGGNPNGISTSQIQQALTLGREPQAKVSVSNLNGTYDSSATEDPARGNSQWGTDSSSYRYLANSRNVSGTFLVATYTNLQHSYYYDANGNKHNISKIVRTISNLSGEDKPVYNFNNYNPYVWIYDDPTDGIWYGDSAGVTVTDQYYDENGNLLNLNHNAWMAITSLNNENDSQHVEGFQVLNGGTGYALLGSSVSNHNGALYADNDNSDKTNPNNNLWWDLRNSPNQYYGSALAELNGTSASLRFFTNGVPNDTWATTTTIIPSTPGPQYKYTTVHYHNNSVRVFVVLFGCA